MGNVDRYISTQMSVYYETCRSLAIGVGLLLAGRRPLSRNQQIFLANFRNRPIAVIQASSLSDRYATKIGHSATTI